MVEAPVEYRGTTVQVCGLYPFYAGSGTPMVGVPIGRHLATGATVCCDPISWFQRARLIRNPSMFILGLPGLGKSTLMRRMMIGLAGYGVVPLVLGDIRPDYVDTVRALGGQVIRLGDGRGYLNVLDPGEAREAAERLTGKAREELLADTRARRAATVSALITIQRAGAVSERERTILERALDVLDERHDGVPVLADLLRVVQDAPEPLRQVAVDRGLTERYQALTEGLEASLIGLVSGSVLGRTFSGHTSEPMRRDRSVVFDISAIQDSQPELRSAAMMACWSAGFSTVNVAHALAKAELEPMRHYFLCLDEIHQALRSGPAMVDRFDLITRINRRDGVGQIMTTHTMADLYALPTESDRQKARGLVERSGMVTLGGLPAAEMPLLGDVVSLSQKERALLASWQEPASWDPDAGADAHPPGLGKFLLKVGGRTGIPLQVRLTETEHRGGVHETNAMWRATSRLGAPEATAAEEEFLNG